MRVRLDIQCVLDLTIDDGPGDPVDKIKDYLKMGYPDIWLNMDANGTTFYEVDEDGLNSKVLY